MDLFQCPCVESQRCMKQTYFTLITCHSNIQLSPEGEVNSCSKYTETRSIEVNILNAVH